MAIDDFKEMLTDTIVHYKNLGIADGGYGGPIFSETGDTYAARVKWKQKLVRDINGEEVMASGNVLIQGTPLVAPDDKIELADGSTPVILSISRIPDENGPHHSRVWFRVASGD